MERRISEYPFAKKVVTVGGGGGQFVALCGLTDRNYPEYNTAIFGPWDNGSKSGVARIKFGVMPPGDYFFCLYGLMEDPNQIAYAVALLNNREETPQLETPMLRDLLANSAEKKYHGINEGVDAIRGLLRIRGKVIPVSTMDLTLYCETSNGEIIKGETNIDKRGETADFDPKNVTRNIFFDIEAQANPRAIEEMHQADKIVFTQGSPYTSIYPHLRVNGITQAIMESTAELTVVLNLSTTKGEDHHLDTVSKWLHEFEHLLGERKAILKGKKNSRIDRIIINNDSIDEEVEVDYINKGQGLVRYDIEECAIIARGIEIIETGLIDEDEMTKNRLLRTDSQKLALAILN